MLSVSFYQAQAEAIPKQSCDCQSSFNFYVVVELQTSHENLKTYKNLKHSQTLDIYSDSMPFPLNIRVFKNRITGGRINRRTNGPKDRPSYRDAWMYLKVYCKIAENG